MSPEMSETDNDILESIKSWIWSGFYDPDEIQVMIGDILEEDADEAMLRGAVEPEFDRKHDAEQSWPVETDCDRLDAAFAELSDNGILALHNAGYTMSEGISDVTEVLKELGRDGLRGYCFYHGQDVERALAGGGLYIAYGDLHDETSKSVTVGEAVRKVLEQHGFKVAWNGTADDRIHVPLFDWKRRSVQSTDE
jgi:hypothetical protein